MVQLKEGVLIYGNQYTNAILTASQTVYDDYGWPLTVTSGRDSHKTGYHPEDRALDLRVSMIPEARREKVAAEIRAKLPHYYDVIYEPEIVEDGKVIKGAHIHAEADAKKEGNKSGPL